MREWGTELNFSHEIPQRLPIPVPTGSQAPVNEAESRLRQLLLRAGFPEGEWQQQIQLGRPLGSTSPDCFFPGEDESDPGLCIYLDGLSQHLHGNPETAARDRAIREELRARHFEVFEIKASDLWDQAAMQQYFFRLGRVLLGKDRARDIRDKPEWFEDRDAESTAH